MSLPIERGGAVPVYFQISEHFKRLIRDGSLRTGDPLPSESQLAAQLGVSKMTVRQAMKDLELAGLITRARGKGTFVAFPRLRHDLGQLTSFTEDISARGMAPSSRILACEEVAAEEAVAESLGGAPGMTVQRIRRLRLADGKPAGIHDTFLRGVIVERAELEARGSLYALLEDRGVRLLSAEETIEAVAADREEASLLGIPPGAPLMLVSRVTRGETGIPVEFVKAFYRADFYRYTVRLQRERRGE